jgi:hypothetical protein
MRVTKFDYKIGDIIYRDFRHLFIDKITELHAQRECALCAKAVIAAVKRYKK